MEQPLRYVVVLLAGLAGLASACRRADTTPAPGASSSSRGTPPPNTPALTALSELTNANLVLPPDRGAAERLPLLLLLHGFGDSGRHFAESSQWARFASTRRIAWVSPDGALDSSGKRFWNAGPSCCNFDGLPIDHVGALRGLLERSLATGAIDPDQVFALGFSNGGFLAHRLACELDGLVKAVVSISGAGPLETVPCPARSAVRVLEIHGDSDPVVSYAGGRVFRRGAPREHLSTERTVGDWAKRLGCRPDPRPAGELDLEAQLPGNETSIRRFEGCARGGVELWTVHGGQHALGFGGPGQGVIWSFLTTR